MNLYALLTRQPPARLIAAGLLLVVTAQLWPGMPVAGAIALVGMGASRHLAAAHHPWRLLVAGFNTLVYSSLASLALAAEANGLVRVKALVTADALAAAVLVGVLVTHLVREAERGARAA